MSMKDVYLSKRMEAVVNMVSPQSFTIADVGCDHAYVSIALRQRKQAQKVIAMDVRTGPLEIAKSNVSEAGYADEIDIRLGDGLERLQPGEADGIIIAGMGGLLMKGILERGRDVLCQCEKRPTLILQPQSDLKEVRMFLYQQAYDIVCETMLIEEGKYYTIMKAEPKPLGESSECSFDESQADVCHLFSEEEWLYGAYNLRNRNEVLHSYLQKEQEVLQQILNKVEASIATSMKQHQDVPDSTRLRLESVRQEISWNEKALQYYV